MNSHHVSWASAGTVVVLDDDAGVCETLCRFVARAGRTAVALAPGPAMVDEVLAARPGLVLLDLSLGRHDAVQVLCSLGRSQFHGSVALISGLGTETIEEVRSIGLRSGLRMLSSLAKPIGSRQLDRVLEEAQLGAGDLQPLPLFDVAEALERRWMTVWYQPQIDIARRSVFGFEALVRIAHPEQGLIGPDRFIPNASAGDLADMTAFVTRSVAEDFGRLGEPARSIRVSINVPLCTLLKGTIVELIADGWSGAPWRPPLTIELTEDRASLEADAINDLATQLRLYGASLSLDDFGAGFSSFHPLQAIRFSEIKLDKRYVIGCGANRELAAICRSTVDLARHFQVRAVAEGVESAADLDVVVAAGFDLVQGFYFAPPMPFSQVQSALANTRE